MGRMGYWNKIRKDFPKHFKKMSKIEKEIGVTVLRHQSGEKKGERMYLDDLPENVGRFSDEPSISCGIDCQITAQELTDLNKGE